MTIVVSFYCSDGIVIAADSMLTATMGTMPVSHRRGHKISLMPGPLVFSFAGDHGQSIRFGIVAEQISNLIQTGQVNFNHPMDFPIAVTAEVLRQFEATGIQHVAMNAVLAYEHGGAHHCCVFEGNVQPRPVDSRHFYSVLGGGILGGDPFLRFLVDVFCPQEPPTVAEAIFLSTWAIQHVITTNPGGVAGPIKIAVFERNASGSLVGRELPDTEIAEHKQAVESACLSLVTWRQNMQAGSAAIDPPPSFVEPVISAPSVSRGIGLTQEEILESPQQPQPASSTGT